MTKPGARVQPERRTASTGKLNEKKVPTLEGPAATTAWLLLADVWWASEAKNADASGHLKQKKGNLKRH